jgi:hypothetical protein
MYARDEDIGAEMACPDCGTMCKILRPPPEKKKTEPPPDAGDELELEEATARPTLKDLGVAHFFERDESGDSVRGGTSARRPLKDGPSAPPSSPAERYIRERPPPSFQPSIFRCFQFAVSSSAWRVTVGLAGWIILLQFAVAAALFVYGNTGFGVLYVVLVGVVAFVSFVCSLAYGMAIVEGTSAGSEDIEDWPQILQLEWLADSFYMLYALMLAAAISSAPRVLFGEIAPWTAWLVAPGVLVLFPFILLSMLYNSSPLNPFSWRVVQCFGVAPGNWILHYLTSFAIWAGVFAVTIGPILIETPFLLFLVAPIYAAAWVVYFRLLGLLAWQCTVALNELDERQESESETRDDEPSTVAPEASTKNDEFFG